jgi:putative ATPase
MSLFDHARKTQYARQAPLADRMRPRTLDEFVGQDHIIGEGRLLRRAIEADQLSSMIFWGPPGVGKTTLARIIAENTDRYFATLNAVTSGIGDLREIIKDAKDKLGMYGQGTVLFIDEIHRWNRAQQDALLPHVEDGSVILIGATTENPFYSVITTLLSRSRMFELKPLSDDDLRQILQRALEDSERGYGKRKVDLTAPAREHFVWVSGGDARNALNALELAIKTTPPNDQGVTVVNREVAQESIQRRVIRYDRSGDEHYDTISAFIKSVRGSDPDAALYWMAKMLSAGEDPRFILRRMFILASEDIGLADPNALTVVSSAAHAYEFVGMPEGHFFLSQAALYLAAAPKSNSAGAIWKAVDYVEKHGPGPVPPYLADKTDQLRGAARTKYEKYFKEKIWQGQGYQYPHAYPDHWVDQKYLPLDMEPPGWYEPSDQGFEATVKKRLESLQERRERGQNPPKSPREGA